MLIIVLLLMNETVHVKNVHTEPTRARYMEHGKIFVRLLHGFMKINMVVVSPLPVACLFDLMFQ